MLDIVKLDLFGNRRREIVDSMPHVSMRKKYMFDACAMRCKDLVLDAPHREDVAS
jgi:hypothetical protein